MDELPFPVGFKLQLGWREQVRRGELPAPGGELYGLLRGSGLAYVEFGVGSCRRPAEQALLRREAAGCRQWNLGATIHPYLGGQENPAHFGESAEPEAALESVLRAAALAAQTVDGPCGLVLHPAEASYQQGARPAPLRARLLERSQRFAAALARAAGERFPRVEPALEHQVPPAPDERIIRIGDTFRELLQAVAGTGLGLCWDTGHYLLSVERHGQAGRPPAQFVGRVRMVHLHDVVEGRDHRIVSRGSKDVREHLLTLREAGFRGRVTLEYSAEAIAEAGGFEPVIEQSLDALRGWLA